MSTQQSLRQQDTAGPKKPFSQQPGPRKGSGKRTKPLTLVVGALVAMMLIVGIFFFIAQINQPDLGPKPISSQDLRQITGISIAEFETIGTGKGVTPPDALSRHGQRPDLALGANGKPLIFYHGGEYCPFCAAERWSLVIALSQFGTFSHLEQIRSSEEQIATFTFQRASYQSPYVDLLAVERSQNPFDSDPPMTQQERNILATYDTPPYVSSDMQGKIPFVDLANQYLQAGAGFDMQILLDRSWQEIVHSLSDPSSPISQQIIGTANYLIAAICSSTHNQPAQACSRPAILKIQHQDNRPPIRKIFLA